MMRLSTLLLACLPLLFSGCHWLQTMAVRKPVVVPPPELLAEQPNLEQVAQVINANTAKVVSLRSRSASLRAEGMLASLSADFAFARPNYLSLKGSLMGAQQLDLGSNDELFWFWWRYNPEPGVYFCRHDQFAQSPAKTLLPLEPAWMAESLGLVQIDTTDPATELVPGHPGQLELRRVTPGPEGETTRITVIDAKSGVVLSQHVYDASGNRVAVAMLRRHQHDPVQGITLPREISFEWPNAQLSFTLVLENLQINTVDPTWETLWTKPSLADSPDIDLAQFGPQPANAAWQNPASADPPTAYPAGDPTAAADAALYRGQDPGRPMPGPTRTVWRQGPRQH